MELIPDTTKLLQILFLDIVLAGDNAIIIGMVAARFIDPIDRRKIIIYGTALAIILRIVFAIFTIQLLAIKGISIIGSILLLIVAWKLLKEIRQNNLVAAPTNTLNLDDKKSLSIRSAVYQIALADMSMSLDNVLGVAGIAGKNYTLLVIGLVLSIILMTTAASYIAKLLQKKPWIAYFGVLTIFYVGLKMGYDGIVSMQLGLL